MSLTLPAAAARLRREVTTAEAAFDAALIASSAIQQTIVTSRRELELPAHTGQQALIRMQRAQAQLVAAQNDLLRAHDELTRIGVTMMPEEPYKPSSGLSDDEPAHRDAA